MADTAWKCNNCNEMTDRADLVHLYECGCGTSFTNETANDGNHQCPECFKFAALSSEEGCPECNEGVCEERDAGEVAAEAEAEEGKHPKCKAIRHRLYGGEERDGRLHYRRIYPIFEDGPLPLSPPTFILKAEPCRSDGIGADGLCYKCDGGWLDYSEAERWDDHVEGARPDDGPLCAAL